MLSMSDNCGRPRRWTGLVAIKAAAISGSAAFFDPSTRIRPLSRVFPVILKASMQRCSPLRVLAQPRRRFESVVGVAPNSLWTPRG